MVMHRPSILVKSQFKIYIQDKTQEYRSTERENILKTSVCYLKVLYPNFLFGILVIPGFLLDITRLWVSLERYMKVM